MFLLNVCFFLHVFKCLCLRNSLSLWLLKTLENNREIQLGNIGQLLVHFEKQQFLRRYS